MLVLVTGGTGLVGSHTVAALAGAGHRIRVLARSGPAPGGAWPDEAAVEVVAGDVTDPGDVDRAVRGVDAVVHAASVYSFDSRMHAAMRRTNLRGTELVLDAARRAGARTVHVSTFGAMLPAAGRVVRVDGPLGTAREPYLASKIAAEAVARRHQSEGAPVTIVYPPALLGPSDPKLGDQNARLRNLLRGLMPMWPTGGFPIGDVRDTAALLASLVDAEPGAPRRSFGPGRYLSTRDYVAAAREATGRALPCVFVPAAPMLPLAALMSAAQRVWPWHIPAEYGAVYTAACAARPHGAPGGRPLGETLTDTIAWLHRTGRLTARQAGAAAGGASH